MNKAKYEEFLKKVSTDYDKVWDEYEELGREDKQEKVFEMYIMEELLNLLEMQIITDDPTIDMLMERENIMRYLLVSYENSEGMELAEEKIKYFIFELQGE